MTRKRKRILIGLGVFLSLYALAINFIADGFLSPPRFVFPLPPGFLSRSVPGKRGLIPVWSTPNLRSAKAVVVLIHGYTGSRANFTGLMRDLEDEGVASVAIALPGHDTNPEKMCSFGSKETDDVGSVLEWIKKQRRGRQPKIIVGGVSLGGSIAWNASRRYKVDGVFVESTFPSFREATTSYLVSHFGFGYLLLMPAVHLAEYKVGVDPFAQSSIIAAQHWKGKPCAVIHSDGDRLFPLSYGKRLAKAAGVKLCVFHGAEHAACRRADPEKYLDTVMSVVNAALGSARIVANS